MAYRLLISRLHNAKRKITLVSLILLFTTTVWGDLLTEDFTTRTYFSSGTEVLNQTLGFAHPPMQIKGWSQLCGVATDTPVDYGNSQHGSFNPTTYTLFGTYSSSVIYINTDTYPVLSVTDFTLNVGDTIQPIGNNPLIIKSLSDITINGTIDCSGDPGQNATNSPTTPSSGGAGRCGGGNGGTGGTTGTAATAGTVGEAAAATITAGGGATGVGGAGGGGGGGFYWTSPGCGSAGTHGATAGAGATPGAAGANSMDGGFTKTGGGAGGGGGAPSATWSGAGGGAGGGRIELISFRNIVLGAGSNVKAFGGNGGTSAGNSGGGGSGAGGSIKIHAGQTLTVNAAANVRVQNGTAGTSATGSAGGTGAWGRVWVISSAGFYSGAPVDAADFSLLTPGAMQFQLGTYSITTGPYDLANTKTTITNVATTLLNAASGTATITVNGSKNGFAIDSTGFQTLASFATLSGSRYIQFKADMNNTNATAPIELDAVTLTYTPGPTNSYTYTAGCGSIKNFEQMPSLLNQLILILVLLLPIFILIFQKFYSRKFIASLRKYLLHFYS